VPPDDVPALRRANPKFEEVDRRFALAPTTEPFDRGVP